MVGGWIDIPIWLACDCGVAAEADAAVVVGVAVLPACAAVEDDGPGAVSD